MGSSYKRSFISVEAKITEIEIALVESELGITLPDELKKHYLEFNGGSPICVYYTNNYDSFVVDKFIPIKYGSSLIFEDVYRQHIIEDKIIPSYLIPFAIDPGGDYFCISTREYDKGKIYFFWTEFYDKLDRAIRYVAPSLKEFIDSMGEEPPE